MFNAVYETPSLEVLEIPDHEVLTNSLPEPTPPPNVGEGGWGGTTWL